ncbi:MAG: type II toxin-antitoxin system RelE/ParE family toxin [Balneolales bacterium]
MKNVKFYKTDQGKCPVEEFLDSLIPKHARKVAWVLELFEKLDHIPAEYFKKLKNSDEIWEVRAKMGSDSFRLLGFNDDGEFIVLTNGFAKKSQKTPKQEIELAERRKTNYLARKSQK